VSDEYFVVPGTNNFAAGGSFTENRFQVGSTANRRCFFHAPLLPIQAVICDRLSDFRLGLTFVFKPLCHIPTDSEADRSERDHSDWSPNRYDKLDVAPTAKQSRQYNRP